jgi:hypothetical protein
MPLAAPSIERAPGQPRRRLPAIEKNVAEISADKDVRVRILGTVIDSTEDSLLVDDGTGKAEVSWDAPEATAGLSRGQLVRVVARVLPLIDGWALRGEALQRLEGFDLQLYKKARQVVV